MRFAIAGTLLLAVASHAAAQRPGDSVFVVPGSHLDLGFTAPINEIGPQRIQIIDQAMAIAASNRNFVWFEEGGWSVDQWLDHYHNDPMRIGQLRALVERGQFGVGATLLSPHAAAFPGALRLLTTHLDRVQRELGRRPTVAVINDVPAIPEAIVDALAAAGIKYLLLGPNLVFSAPLPARVTKAPFYWESSHGARVLVSIDPEGYGAGLTRWLLPPDCIRAMAPRQFPAAMSDDSIFALGVGRELAQHRSGQPLMVVQHASDNGDAACVARLGDALQRYNQRSRATKLIAALPDEYFKHFEAHHAGVIPVLRGEWGGDWDLLRASEPVWSWRLRDAIASITAATDRALKIAAVMVTDHNVGLGPRWQDGSPATMAQAHIAQVLNLYRVVVQAALGAPALTRVPAPLAMPSSAQWPQAWQRIFGDRATAARVRAGPAFIYPLVDVNAPDMHTPITLNADGNRALLRTTIDRVDFERRIGARYQAVIELTLRAPIGTVKLMPETPSGGPAAEWLLGNPTGRVVSPSGVRVSGPGWSFHAGGPLLIGWSLVPDARDPAITHLQALAVVNAVEGVVTDGQKLRLPFAAMYPGEPASPQFDLEVRLVPSQASGPTHRQ